MKFNKSRREHQRLVLCRSGEFDLGILDIPSLNSAFLWISKMDSEMDMYTYSGPILKLLLIFVILISFSISQVLFLGLLARSRAGWLYLLSTACHLHTLNYASRREVVFFTSLALTLGVDKPYGLDTVVEGVLTQRCLTSRPWMGYL